MAKDPGTNGLNRSGRPKTFAEKADILRRFGYGPRRPGDVKWVNQAWGNYQQALRLGKNPRKAGAYWTAANRRASGLGGAVNRAGNVAGDRAAPSGGGGRSTTGSKKSKTSVTKQLASLIAQARGNLIDPADYAKASADSEYGAVISALQQQLKRFPMQAEQNLADIGNWYGQVESTRAAGAKSNAADLASALTTQQDATKAFISAIGGSANQGSAGVAQQGLIDVAGLQGQGMATANFDNDMAAVLALQRAGDQTRQKNMDTSALQDLRGQLLSARNERGSAFAKALGDASQMRFDQLGQLQNMVLGNALAGPQLTGANLDNILKGAQIEQTSVMTAQEKARLADFMNQQGNGPGTMLSELEPGARAQLAQYLTQEMLGPKGNFTVYPGSIGNRLRQRFYDIAGFSRQDSSASSFIEGLIKSTLTPGRISWWNRRYPNQKYNG